MVGEGTSIAAPRWRRGCGAPNGRLAGPSTSTGAVEFAHPRPIDLQHLPIREGQRRERRLLHVYRHAEFIGKRGTRCPDLRRTPLRRTTRAAEAYVSLHPMDLGLLGPYAAMKVALLSRSHFALDNMACHAYQADL